MEQQQQSNKEEQPKEGQSNKEGQPNGIKPASSSAALKRILKEL